MLAYTKGACAVPGASTTVASTTSPSTSTTSTSFVPDVVRCATPVPVGAGVDLVLLIDTSLGFGATNLNRAREFVLSTLLALREAAHVQVAVVSFNSKTTLMVPLTSPVQAELLFRGMSLKAGGSTAIGFALEELGWSILSSHVRGESTRVAKVVLLSDGRTQEHPSTLVDAADAFRSYGIELLAVGVGQRVNQAYLQLFAGESSSFMTLSTIDTDDRSQVQALGGAVACNNVQKVQDEDSSSNGDSLEPEPLPTKVPEKVTLESTGTCSGAPFNVIFMVDSSKGFGEGTYRNAMEIISRVTPVFSKLNVGVSVLSYSSAVSIVLDMVAARNSTLAASALLSAPFEGSSTVTAEALSFGLENFKPNGTDAKPVSFVLITDGNSQEHEDTLKSALSQARSAGIAIVAVAAGSRINSKEIELIAGDAQHRFNLDQFLDFDAATISLQLAGSICRKLATSPANSSSSGADEEILGSSGGVTQSSFNYNPLAGTVELIVDGDIDISAVTVKMIVAKMNVPVSSATVASVTYVFQSSQVVPRSADDSSRVLKVLLSREDQKGIQALVQAHGGDESHLSIYVSRKVQGVLVSHQVLVFKQPASASSPAKAKILLSLVFSKPVTASTGDEGKLRIFVKSPQSSTLQVFIPQSPGLWVGPREDTLSLNLMLADSDVVKLLSVAGVNASSSSSSSGAQDGTFVKDIVIVSPFSSTQTTPSNSDEVTEKSNSGSSGSLSGASIGWIIGGVALVALVAVIAAFVVHRRSRSGHVELWSLKQPPPTLRPHNSRTGNPSLFSQMGSASHRIQDSPADELRMATLPSPPPFPLQAAAAGSHVNQKPMSPRVVSPANDERVTSPYSHIRSGNNSEDPGRASIAWRSSSSPVPVDL